MKNKIFNFTLLAFMVLTVLTTHAQIFSGPTDVCKTTNYTYSYTDDVTWTTANWSVSGGGTIVSGTGLSRVISWASDGIITVTLYNGANIVSQGTLNVYVMLPGTISGPASVSQGTPVTITKSGQYGSFVWEVSTDGGSTWNGLGSAPSLVHTPSQTSQYQIRNLNTCKAKLSNIHTVTVTASLNITIQGPDAIPLGVTTTLTAPSSFYQYQWMKDEVDIAGQTSHTLVVNEPATYKIKAKATSGSAWQTSDPVIISSSLLHQDGINYKVTTQVFKNGMHTNSDFYDLLPHEVNQSVNYMDGYGRTIQQVAIGQSPEQGDLVQPIQYDHLGRNQYQYLPYATTDATGRYRPDAIVVWSPSADFTQTDLYQFYQSGGTLSQDATPYAKSVFETSPLSRVTEQGAPGTAWQPGSNHTIRSLYRVQNDSDATTAIRNIRKWTTAGPSGYYASNTLSVNETTDENGNKVWQFYDRLGRLVLKRVQLDETVEGVSTPFLETYYVYDNRGNLALQIPPKAMAKINGGTSWNTALRDEWCYVYTYDERNRLVEKKVPDAAVVFYAYDPLDRLVLTQDGNLRGSNKWAFIKYDGKNRPVMAGFYTNTTHTTRTAIQTNVLDPLYASGTWYETRGTTLHGYTNVSFPTTNSNGTALQVLSVNYYDNYDFDNNGTADYNYTPQSLPGEGTQASSFNLPTGSKRLVMNTANWLTTYVFYDKWGRTIQARSNNHLSLTIDNLETMVYNENGTVERVKSYHKGAGGTTVTKVQRMVYDHAGRTTEIHLSINGGAEVQVAEYVYNALGQLIDKKLHSTDGINFLQSVDYRYNIRGWLRSINNAQLTVDNSNDDTNDYFGMELLYNQTESGLSNTAYYNGNVSALKWKGPGEGSGAAGQRSYKMTYDKSDKLKEATFQTYAGGWNAEAGTLNEKLTYDANGNIKTLQRYKNQRGLSGTTVTASPQFIDNLTYTYDASQGNKLTKVEDAASAEGGFINGANMPTEYTYNTNGSLTADKNKGISSIAYNELGKPLTVTFDDGRSVSYLYDGTGNKLRMSITQSGNTVTTDYVGGYVYENNSLSFFGSPEGRVVKNGSNYELQYAIADHQGNTRVVFSSVATAPDVQTATFENPANDAQYFSNVPTALPYWASFTAANHTPGGIKVVRMNQNFKIGPARSLEVFAGDQVDMEVWTYYENSSGFGTTTAPINTLITAIAGAFGGVSGGAGESGAIYNGVNTALGGFGVGGSKGNNAPGAYLNYILFDKQYNVLDMGWAVVPTTALNSQQKISIPTVTAPEAGYMFIYLSYESESNNYVQFDDFKVIHTKTRVVQYNEYYPFGLQTANSWTRESTRGNQFLFNGGTELNNTTSVYDLHYRQYDPALGRMNAVDPMASKYASLTPYNYAFNDPVVFNDPLGDDPNRYGRTSLWDEMKSRTGGPCGCWKDQGPQDAHAGMYGSAMSAGEFLQGYFSGNSWGGHWSGGYGYYFSSEDHALEYAMENFESFAGTEEHAYAKLQGIQSGVHWRYFRNGDLRWTKRNGNNVRFKFLGRSAQTQTQGGPGKIDLFSGAANAYDGIIEWAQYLKNGQASFSIRTPDDGRSINFYNLNDMLSRDFKKHNTSGSDYYNIFSKRYRTDKYNFDVRIPGADGIGDVAKYSLFYVTNVTASILNNSTKMTLYFEGMRSSLNGQVTTVMSVTLYGNMDSFNSVGQSIFTASQWKMILSNAR